ncbi:hypothetical protein SEA_NOSILAM_10 [Gordonia phage NosilaM]|uniref:Uncharacterized protein n=1 Tax=Gordonia phage NosilaM TaxID=2507863 RepID=A0A410TE10_9CAUD|nr:hypothetical protein KNU46_gp10 [Gordonia phage NosilaM]QAU07253.1 hypothetical protein SEA_NOSILAM_10 [Gordonia phage NosilaM]
MSDTRLKVAVGDVLKLRRRMRDFEAERAERKSGQLYSSRKIYRWEYSEVTVTKVGRVYLTAESTNEHGMKWERKFRLDNGSEVGNALDVQVYTEESLAAQERREKALEQLAELTNGYAWRSKLTTDAMVGIVAILTAEGSHDG